MSPLLKEVGELIRGEALAREISLEMDLPEDLGLVSANREDLIRVFTNLLENAIKYNRRGGRVLIRGRKDEGFIGVEIQDTGIGMAKRDLDHIFDEFYRIKTKETRSIPGTGLGLAIARRIVEAHNGQIEVESRPYEGSTFRVLLPI